MLSDDSKAWLRFVYASTDNEDDIAFTNCVAQHARRLPEIVEEVVKSWDEDFPDNPGWKEIAQNIRANK
jgi:hypothetical protein